MSKIHILDEHLTNMIAAGEVVERPSGVVKELVENAIDARAGKITVKVANGGLDCVEVIDDGEGMDPQDAVSAFNRHATSKISKTADLWDIHTMGFRGEALPSIASVSKVSLLTCDGESSTGVNIEYGRIISAGPAPCPQGTDIKVEKLFYKTPARLKHLKSGNTEFNSILDLMQKFALSRPDISFELISDDRTRLKTNGTGSLEEVVTRIYGLDVARNSIPVEFSDYDFRVEGLLVMPSITRSSRQSINCFINGRIIRSFLLQKAVNEGYGGFMMPDRYPLCVLNITVDSQLVDVNVHPSKWEIRLSKEKQLYALISDNISRILKENLRPGEIKVAKPQTIKPVQQELPVSSETVYEYVEDEIQVLSDNRTEIDRFEFLAQLHGNYILAQDENNLYIVDQHAAMERCMYEEIRNQVAAESNVMQTLLVPLNVELTPVQFAHLDRINEVFSCIGISLEPFSSQSAIIREVPAWFDDIREDEFIHDLIDQIINDKNIDRLEIRKDTIATLACHSSIRFNRRLDAMECRQLLRQLGKCSQPFNCPHGRPTMMIISETQLQKEFKRA